MERAGLRSVYLLSLYPRRISCILSMFFNFKMSVIEQKSGQATNSMACWTNPGAEHVANRKNSFPQVLDLGTDINTGPGIAPAEEQGDEFLQGIVATFPAPPFSVWILSLDESS